MSWAFGAGGGDGHRQGKQGFEGKIIFHKCWLMLTVAFYLTSVRRGSSGSVHNQVASKWKSTSYF
jgi:hypothetical protein